MDDQIKAIAAEAGAAAAREILENYVPERWLTADEAAAFLKVTPKYLERLRYEGGGPKFAKWGRQVRYDINELVAFLKALERNAL